MNPKDVVTEYEELTVKIKTLTMAVLEFDIDNMPILIEGEINFYGSTPSTTRSEESNKT